MKKTETSEKLVATSSSDKLIIETSEKLRTEPSKLQVEKISRQSDGMKRLQPQKSSEKLSEKKSSFALHEKNHPSDRLHMETSESKLQTEKKKQGEFVVDDVKPQKNSPKVDEKFRMALIDPSKLDPSKQDPSKAKNLVCFIPESDTPEGQEVFLSSPQGQQFGQVNSKKSNYTNSKKQDIPKNTMKDTVSEDIPKNAKKETVSHDILNKTTTEASSIEAMEETGKKKSLVKKKIAQKVEDSVENNVNEDDNIAFESLVESKNAIEKSNYHVKSFINFHEAKQHQKLSEKQSVDKLKVENVRAEKLKVDNQQAEVFRTSKNTINNQSTESFNNKNSSFQKKRIKKNYAKEFRENIINDSGKIVENGFAKIGEITVKVAKKVITSVNKKWIFIILVMLFTTSFISSTFSACTSVMSSIMTTAFGSSYTAEESDMLQVEANYQAKETALQNRIDNIESEFSGYDEYRYNLSEIGHDPHELAALLTALYHAYTPSEVASKLDEIFAKQYTLTTTPSQETKHTDDGTPYIWNVLTVTLTNSSISSIAKDFLTDDEYEHYLLLRSTLGNNPDLFDSYYGGSGGIGDIDYEIPSHYLTDEAFAKVYAEAIKYLGYPYSWGGQSPSTSFDCSGFMYWIYNSTGVYSHSRLTAQGYYNLCTKFGADQRQPGDFIFFTGTSSHATISHIGMYIGDGMMIHSASAGVHFSSVDTGYWSGSNVYVCYGRLPI